MIPERKQNAITGSEFVEKYISSNRLEVEEAALQELLDGNIPSFLRNFIPIELKDQDNTFVYLTMSDVLSIGSDEDYLRIPLNPISARKVADLYDCALITSKIADDIWKNAKIKLNPTPRGPPYDSSMMALSTFKWHNKIIQNQLENKDKTQLITGHKKDVIFNKDLLNPKYSKNVCIYGWFYPNGKAIQTPPQPKAHEIEYRDYSHGIRLIAKEIKYNEQFLDFYDVMNDKDLSRFISNEGAYDTKKMYIP